MRKDQIKISMYAIICGLFAVVVSEAQPFVLLAPIMSVLVGQTGQALGTETKSLNRLTVAIITIFLVVLPFIDRHPKAISNLKVAFEQNYDWLRKSLPFTYDKPVDNKRNPNPRRPSNSESAKRGTSAK